MTYFHQYLIKIITRLTFTHTRLSITLYGFYQFFIIRIKYKRHKIHNKNTINLPYPLCGSLRKYHYLLLYLQTTFE